MPSDSTKAQPQGYDEWGVYRVITGAPSPPQPTSSQEIFCGPESALPSRMAVTPPQPTGEDAEPPAVTNLRNYQRQLDEDGIEVGVSRQALDETLAHLDRLAIALSARSAELEAAREALAAHEWIPIDDTRRPIDGTPILAKTADGRCMVFSGRILETALRSDTPDHLTFPAIAWMRVP